MIRLISFGMKKGSHPPCDHIVDCRGIPNPYLVPHLKERNGLDEEVQKMVERGGGGVIVTVMSIIDSEYIWKADVTVALRCTGGRHRSVAVAEIVGRMQRGLGRDVVIEHRDIEK